MYSYIRRVCVTLVKILRIMRIWLYSRSFYKNKIVSPLHPAQPYIYYCLTFNAAYNNVSLARQHSIRNRVLLTLVAIKPWCYIHLFATAGILVSRALKKRVYPTLVTRMHLGFSERKLFFNFPRKLLSPVENLCFSLKYFEMMSLYCVISTL